MGRFFTNVHVRPRAGLRDARETLLAALEARAKSEGLVAASPPERCDRLVAVGTPADRGWITVADESTEPQDADVLETLAKSLSTAVDGYALAVLVHDSDVLDLRLIDKGRRVDHFVNNPDYFDDRGTRSTKARQAVRGRPEAWAPLLVNKSETDALEAAFRSTPVFAEEMLAEIARLLGLGAGYDVGATDLKQEREPGFEIRCFKDPAADLAETGRPPTFEPGSWALPLEVSEGEALHWSTSVLNKGGPADGVEVAISGTAVDRGLIQVSRAACAVPLGDHEMTRATAELDVRNGRAAVSFPEVRVPSPTRSLAAPQVIVMLEGRVERAGRGQLQLRVQPIAAPDRGVSQSIDVTIGPALPRPLNAPDASAAAALRALQSPATLVGVVAIRESQPIAASLGADAMALGRRDLRLEARGVCHDHVHRTAAGTRALLVERHSGW